MEKYIAKFTEIMREADKLFETVGGSTRHYVRDVLFPIMEREGLTVTEASTADSATQPLLTDEDVKAWEDMKKEERAGNELRQAQSVIAELLDADLTPEWISVDDELPEEGGRYWCYVEEINSLGVSHYQWNCAYNEVEQRWSDGAMKCGDTVTHWMPLPHPPCHKPSVRKKEKGAVWVKDRHPQEGRKVLCQLEDNAYLYIEYFEAWKGWWTKHVVRWLDEGEKGEGKV